MTKRFWSGSVVACVSLTFALMNCGGNGGDSGPTNAEAGAGGTAGSAAGGSTGGGDASTTGGTAGTGGGSGGSAGAGGTGGTGGGAPRVDVLTQRNDIARSGLNLAETALDVSNVNGESFGKVFSRAVDDEIYAQPLVVTDLDMPAHGVRDVVFVATVNDSVYAFDAENPDENEPLWHVSFLSDGSRPTLNTDMTGACGGNYRDFSGHIGIVSTPVIDLETNTMYVVARTVEDGEQFQRIHALDIRDGSERPNSPTTITATIVGSGDGSDGETVEFDSLRENQRAALLLLDGVIYIAWAGHCDWDPYHGWILGYDATTLEQVVTYNVTPDGAAGGIWQSGQGLASDGTYIYVVTGNGTIGVEDDPRSTINRGQSFLKMQRTGSSLDILTWFTPYDYERLETLDLDLGSAGLLLIPGTHLAVSSGKGGTMYVVDRDDMGGLSTSDESDDNIIQSFPVNPPNHVHGTPLFWDGPDYARVYVWAEEDFLKAFRYLGESYEIGSSVLDVENARTSTMRAPSDIENRIEMPGGFLSLSSNGKTPGTGILWVNIPFSGDANQMVRPGVLRAFDATDVSQELWNSKDNEARDDCGDFAKFVPPTVANGKVYLASFEGQLCVYGLL